MPGQPPWTHARSRLARLPGARSAREQGPCDSRAESAKPELRLFRRFRHRPILSQPRAISELQTEGACWLSLGGGPPERAVAGAPTGAQRGGPWRAAGSGPWALAARREGSSACPRSRRSPVPLKARPVSSPASLHLSVSLSVSPSLCLSVSVSPSPTSPLSHTHIALAVFLRSCMIFSRKMSLHLPRGISSECLLTPLWGTACHRPEE